MLMPATETPLLDAQTIADAADRTARAIPPLWPLASSVAVNPFLGQTGETLATTAVRLRRTAGTSVTMPRAWYRARIAAGDITDGDLLAAWKIAPAALRPAGIAEVKQAVRMERGDVAAIPTIAELARDASGIDWPALVAERIGHWAAGYFDEGQALWTNLQGDSPYAAWRTFATHDLTPEMAGLAAFARQVAATPVAGQAALSEAVSRLGVPRDALDVYCHRLLMTMGGWSQVARYRLWQAELGGGSDDCVTDLLTIRMTWEVALLRHYSAVLATPWQAALAAFAEPVVAGRDDVLDALLQEAAERAGQRRVRAILANAPAAPLSAGRPKLQMAFCIDVRSEVFRRALESFDPQVRTLGFAGFFGLGIGHRRFASDVVEARLPVLLTPGLQTASGDGTSDVQKADFAARIAARARRAWGRFKLAAISSFAFVEAAGPIYFAKLLKDALGVSRNAAPNDPAPHLATTDFDTRVGMAAAILKAMSLTDGFASLVLLAGHGANVVNNPHASGLHCGACGGYPGDVNARLLASLLNEAEVRDGLARGGIAIPADTLFVAALHDTTTDHVTLYDADHPSAGHAAILAQARQWLQAAAVLARGERALRLPRAGSAGSIWRRARDWAELRPEWALAGCQTFIAAPRARTAGCDFAGRSFLHDYCWQQDEGFAVLELILTAPVVVASWISLQYYGSTVAPDVFGGGNKLLHNVTGGIGVVEGNGGLLRAGLPWQSVHDGEALVHEPLRLTVVIDAPRDAIADILARHPEVRALFDNRWLHLFALDDSGRMAWRYAGNLAWSDDLDATTA